MSNSCQRCGPVKHDAPIILCAPCGLEDFARVLRTGLDPDLVRPFIIAIDELSAHLKKLLLELT